YNIIAALNMNVENMGINLFFGCPFIWEPKEIYLWSRVGVISCYNKKIYDFVIYGVVKENMIARFHEHDPYLMVFPQIKFQEWEYVGTCLFFLGAKLAWRMHVWLIDAAHE
ncbi:hypothetical protein ACJX0J_022033, partial [Zea mays]